MKCINYVFEMLYVHDRYHDFHIKWHRFNLCATHILFHYIDCSFGLWRMCIGNVEINKIHRKSNYFYCAYIISIFRLILLFLVCVCIGHVEINKILLQTIFLVYLLVTWMIKCIFIYYHFTVHLSSMANEYASPPFKQFQTTDNRAPANVRSTNTPLYNCDGACSGPHTDTPTWHWQCSNYMLLC